MTTPPPSAAPSPAPPAPRDAFSRILHNTGWLLGSKGVGAVLSLFYLAIVTRSLGVAEFGRFALILGTATAINTLVTFDSWQVLVRYGQRHRAAAGTAAEGADALNRLVRLCIAIDIGSALIGCALAAAVALLLGPRFGWTAEVARGAFLFCAVMLLTIRSTPTGLLRLFDRFDAAALADTMIPISRMIGALIVLALSPSIIAFLIVWAGAELVCAVTYWTLGLRAARGRIGHWRAGSVRDAPAENPGIAGFLLTTNLQTTMTAGGRQLVVLLIGLFVGPVAAGLYRLANQLAQAMTKIAGLLSRSIFTELSRVHANADHAELRAVYRRTTRLAMVGGLVTVGLILLLGRPLILLMSGPDYLPAYPLMVLLGAAASIDLIGVAFAPLLMATGRATWSLRITASVTALLLVLILLLMPRMGVTGAAVAALASSCVGYVLLRIASARALRHEGARGA